MIIAKDDLDTRKIILDELIQKKDIEKLLLLLDSNKFLEINFFNIQIIPKDIIIMLNNKKDHLAIFTQF